MRLRDLVGLLGALICSKMDLPFGFTERNLPVNFRPLEAQQSIQDACAQKLNRMKSVLSMAFGLLEDPC